MIAFRVDTNETVATGHFMRCLSIANALKKSGNEVVFITADDTGKGFAEAQGFFAISLGTLWNNMVSEYVYLEKYITENNIKKIIIDSYYVTAEYLQKLSNITDIFYIDDIFAFRYQVNTIINYNIYGIKKNMKTYMKTTHQTYY